MHYQIYADFDISFKRITKDNQELICLEVSDRKSPSKTCYFKAHCGNMDRAFESMICEWYPNSQAAKAVLALRRLEEKYA